MSEIANFCSILSLLVSLVCFGYIFKINAKIKVNIANKSGNKQESKGFNNKQEMNIG